MSESAACQPAVVTMGEPTFASLRARARLAERATPLDHSDLIDWADLCLAIGHRAEARFLHQIAAIRTGFSRQLVAAQDALGLSNGLWTGAQEGMKTTAPGGVVDIAIADLKSYATAFAARPAPVAARHVADGIEVDAHRNHAVANDGSMPSLELGEAVGALFDRLRETPDSASDQIATIWLALRNAADDAPELDHRHFVGASMPLLASAIGFDAIRGFLSDHRDLIEGDCASVGLFHRAARFDSFGLGPYFTRVAQVVRRYRDLLELAEIAYETATAAGDGASLDHWIVQLSRSIDGPLLDEVIDELGDAGRAESLGGILDRLMMARPARIDWNRVMRIRDASLDNLDYPLASRAQRFVAEALSDVAVEWNILATIDGTGGRIAAAEQSFEHCLKLDPSDLEPLARIKALRGGKFDLYVIDRGFGTPEDRQLGRLRRRKGRTFAVEAERKSVIGVEVNY